MATYARSVRRGLPRVAGGDPWPPADVVAVTADGPDAPPTSTAASAPAAVEVPAPAVERAAPAVNDAATAPARTTASRPQVRRGLPRVPGGEPWPPADAAVPAAQATVASPHASAEPAPQSSAAAESPAAHASARPSAPPVAAAAAGDGVALRRGLPRVAGGEPWPPAGFAPTSAPAAEADPDAVAAVVSEQPPAASAEAAVPVPSGPRAPLPFTPAVWPGAAASAPRAAERAEPRRYGPFTRLQWAGAVVVLGAGLLIAAGMAVALVRWLLSTQWGEGFLAQYPGEYHLPEGAPVGFPAWLGWQHFFNAFLIILIIRSGLQVRREKRPSVFWSPRGNSKRKISLALWFHQSLDILWLVNGVVFVILLFVSGQWMRIIPTSWEVFPNAVSAALQYVSLDWPTENGWVNYNALQQIAYFTTVFVAAPLAALTGVRMSGIWPKDATTLNRLYPLEWARRIHFPVMIYFVVFIVAHVALVFATGALRNLNHMYAAQGSVDPNAYADNWTGFWIFIGSVVVMAAAWIAARPLVLAPIARLFGKVSGR
ncbi:MULTISPECIES: cytochrome b/b6 domain-containing protein [Microbacterium]|uniref:Cytochrome b/b6 domain-containing protein n=1 Tax=Microbacterium wangchenii TaxID=2541726 RepID=A0ABX5SVJ7_9MICO|nr:MULTISPECIES: cytochrome b/b6 domain-containing protein [Microbacterium]MCK6065910.1 cytochrome b/b6 domain-containing protein [Microbacterium sp. EYE_512]QBR90210.1 cytochrome b/b6 domain-containing protein [Microbacterium wangchenii]TXK11775.1 cytochrome b/b6 domain-containing protein [Microbacterium wangchenii]